MIKHDRRYYDEARPLISDQEYDQKMRQLLAYEKEHPSLIDPKSPAQRVAEAPTEGFEQRAHLVPMYSLANTYSEEEVEAFVQRVHKLLEKEKVPFCCELKIDGTAISLLYKQGKLTHATTRGNGKVGDDVTANIKTIHSIPLVIEGDTVPETLEVRGEVYMSLATFEALNKMRQEEGLEVFANPRNAAAGSLKLLDPRLVAKRKLQLMMYGIAEGFEGVLTQHEVHARLKRWGFPTAAPSHLAIASNAKEILSFAHTVEKKREELPFEIDGIVVKVNELKYHALLGHTGKTPRFAIAYKFAPEQAVTRIREITVQVGRSGVLTPVAELEPVFLSGSTISRATLHNQEEVARKEIREGDFVFIEKGGDVIPKVVKVDFDRRPSDSRPWQMPTHCPICKTKVVHTAGEVAVRCPNSLCMGQRVRRIQYFASKNAMDIEHLGEKVVEQLVEKGLVSRVSDLYLLDEASLQELDGFKEKSIRNLLDSIQSSTQCTLARFIMALGIPSVGTETAEALAEATGSVEQLLSMDEVALLAIEGIGEKTAHGIASFVRDPNTLEEIRLLLAHGVAPRKEEKRQIAGHPFSGKSFVLTGSLSRYTREEAAALIKERGGKVVGSVSKNTDYLLMGEEPGSKYEKAKSLQVTILDERAFQDLLNLEA